MNGTLSFYECRLSGGDTFMHTHEHNHLFVVIRGYNFQDRMTVDLFTDMYIQSDYAG